MLGRRVRFARLSRIRTILGCPPEDEDIPTDAYKFVEDDEYLIVDLSIHWVNTCSNRDRERGLVLIHSSLRFRLATV
jgi:hypothetical protein